MANKDLSIGNPWKIITLFAIPMVLSITLQQVYNIADSLIAGRIIGGSALAAISASYPITMIFLCFAAGAGTGANIIVSRLFGMKNYGELKTAVYTSLITFFGFAVVLGVIGVITCRPLLIALNTDSVILEDAATYLNFYCFGMVFLFIYNIVTSIFQALGNSKTPLFFLIFSTVLNIALDIVFSINGLGVMGIALATFIAQGLACILSLLWLLYSIRKLKSEKPKIYSFFIIKVILKIAIPSMLQTSAVSIGGVLIQGEINKYGGVVTAGYGAGYKVCYIMINIFVAMSNALSAYTSQNIGAGKKERLKPGLKVTLVLNWSLAIITGILFTVFAEFLVKLFLSEGVSDVLDPNEIINVGAQFLRISCPFYLIVATKISIDGLLKGSGDMRDFIIGTFVDLLARVVLCIIMSNTLGITGVWWSWPISWVVGAAVQVVFYFAGRWKRVVVNT